MQFIATVFDETEEAKTGGIILLIHGGGIRRFENLELTLHVTGHDGDTGDEGDVRVIHSEVPFLVESS